MFSTNCPAARRQGLTGSRIAKPRLRALRLLFFRSVFGSFPSVASAGLCLQCRWPGVKFALYKPQLAAPTATARTLLPDTGAVPLGADDATVGNGPQPPQGPPPQGPEVTTLWNRASSPREPRAPAGGAGPFTRALDLDCDLAVDLACAVDLAVALAPTCRSGRGLRCAGVVNTKTGSRQTHPPTRTPNRHNHDRRP